MGNLDLKQYEKLGPFEIKEQVFAGMIFYKRVNQCMACT